MEKFPLSPSVNLCVQRKISDLESGWKFIAKAKRVKIFRLKVSKEIVVFPQKELKVNSLVKFLVQGGSRSGNVFYFWTFPFF